jgi:hypothetical protein
MKSCIGALLQGVSMGVFSRASANWEAGGYGAFMSVPAANPGLLAAIVPDHTLGCLKDNMPLLQDLSVVSLAHMAYMIHTIARCRPTRLWTE